MLRLNTKVKFNLTYPNLTFREFLLSSGWLDICKKKRFADFSYSNALQGLGTFNESYSIYLGALIPQIYLDYSYKVINSRSKKNQRLAKKITQMLDTPSVFVTLTFRDNVLSETSSKTRRTYVQRFCNNYNCKYIANIDFGQNDKFTRREHYHAIINKDKVNCSDWSYGIINFERVRACSSEMVLAKYVNKFANHATKIGVNTRILTSRKFFD